MVLTVTCDTWLTLNLAPSFSIATQLPEEGRGLDLLPRRRIQPDVRFPAPSVLLSLDNGPGRRRSVVTARRVERRRRNAIKDERTPHRFDLLSLAQWRKADCSVLRQ